MKCPNCSAEIEEGAKFCTNCGYQFDDSAPAPENGGDHVNTGAEALDAVTASDAEKKPESTPYVNTAATAVGAVSGGQKPNNEITLPKQKRAMAPCKPLSTWAFVWRSIVYTIPVIGLILLFVFAFAKNVNENSKSHARAKLIFALIATLVTIVCAVLFFINKDQILTFAGKFLREFINTYGK